MRLVHDGHPETAFHKLRDTFRKTQRYFPPRPLRKKRPPNKPRSTICERVTSVMITVTL